MWQQLAPLELPAWLAWLDKDLKSVISELVYADRQVDAWAVVGNMARRWKDYLGKHAPRQEDLKFFQNRLTSTGGRKTPPRKDKLRQGKALILDLGT